MIPKRIFTIWLNDNPEIPEIVRECILTHQLEGYEHRMITLDNCFRDEFVEEKLKAKEWVMASDYLRIHYLYEEGGIYLDADTKVLKPFDDLLENKAFACKEDNGFVANGIIGFQKGNLLLRQYLDISNIAIKNKEYNDNTRFLGMRLFSLLVYLHDYIKLYPQEYFLPYNHQTGITNITNNTYTNHYYLKSWKQ